MEHLEHHRNFLKVRNIGKGTSVTEHIPAVTYSCLLIRHIYRIRQDHFPYIMAWKTKPHVITIPLALPTQTQPKVLVKLTGSY